MVEAIPVEDETLHGLACTRIVATMSLNRLQQCGCSRQRLLRARGRAVVSEILSPVWHRCPPGWFISWFSTWATPRCPLSIYRSLYASEVVLFLEREMFARS